MAKTYGFDKKSAERIAETVRRDERRGSRGILPHKRRRGAASSADSSDARVTGGYAVIVANVSAATSLSSTGGTPGIGAEDAAQMLVWNGDVTALEQELDEDAQAITRKPVNLSMTAIRASTADPVLVAGFAEDITDSSENEHRLFIITNIMDFRALPGFATGSTSPADDQVPFHQGGNDDFELDGETC